MPRTPIRTRHAGKEEQLAVREVQLSMFRTMLLIREFETATYDLFLRGLVRGTTHLSTGQEAIAAGFAAAMRLDDYTFATYRGHAHVLARGTPLAATLAEIMGRATGLMGGKGGSMHLISPAHGVLGSYAIVGSHLPIAVGAAWSATMRKSGQVAVCFFGDGATNIGAFHEALNLAAVWRLPVVFVCENNLYMEYTPIASVTSVRNPAADRAAAYGLESIVVDGNDADLVLECAETLIARARSGDGPSLVEAQTYRHGGHSRADPAKYRPEAEVRTWLAKDPIPNYRDRLAGLGVSRHDLDAIEASVKQLVEAAVEEALAGPPPPVEAALTQVWVDGSSTWRN